MPLRHELPIIGFAIAASWIALVVLVSFFFRRSKNKSIFRPHFERLLFLETWRSGRSLRSLFTRLGGARNCLWVAIDDNTLWVSPHFPFSLMFLPEVYSLDLSVKGEAIRSVERRSGLLERNRVCVTFSGDCSGEEVFEVSLRDPDGFIRALEAIRKKN